MHTGKGGVNLSLFLDDMAQIQKIIGNPLESHYLISEHSKFLFHKTNIQITVVFQYICNEQYENEIKKTIIFTIDQNMNIQDSIGGKRVQILYPKNYKVLLENLKRPK